MNKLFSTIKILLVKYKELITYAIFGVLTTVVNYIVYFLLLDVMSVNYLVVNVLAWIVAVLFAYVTNRIWVFESRAKGAKMLVEFVSFVGSRLASLGAETLLLFLLVDLAGMGEKLAKIPVGIIVIILNYVLSKLLVFRKTKKDK